MIEQSGHGETLLLAHGQDALPVDFPIVIRALGSPFHQVPKVYSIKQLSKVLVRDVFGTSLAFWIQQLGTKRPEYIVWFLREVKYCIVETSRVAPRLRDDSPLRDLPETTQAAENGALSRSIAAGQQKVHAGLERKIQIFEQHDICRV